MVLKIDNENTPTSFSDNIVYLMHTTGCLKQDCYKALQYADQDPEKAEDILDQFKKNNQYIIKDGINNTERKLDFWEWYQYTHPSIINDDSKEGVQGISQTLLEKGSEEFDAGMKIMANMNSQKKYHKAPITEFKNEYSFLSNFYPVSVEYEGRIYPSAEHAFQAAKTDDEQVREMISMAHTPNQAKKLGEEIPMTNYFINNQYKIMYIIVRNKFFSHPDLAELLIRTENADLIQTNQWHDNTWGDCICWQCQDTAGINYLGNILMIIREEILEDYNACYHFHKDEQRLMQLVIYDIIQRNIGTVVQWIEESNDLETVINKFKYDYGFTDKQAQMITQMKLEDFAKDEREKTLEEMIEIDKRLSNTNFNPKESLFYDYFYTDNKTLEEKIVQ